MTTTEHTRLAYRVLGTTDDVTECGLCGRVELKGTVVLGVLDLDGNVDGVVYYGSSCGARASGWTTKEIRVAAKAADQAARDTKRVEREERDRRWTAARDEWISVNVGPDALDYPRRYGYRGTVALVSHYVDTTGVGW